VFNKETGKFEPLLTPSTTTTQTTENLPQEGETEPTKAPAIPTETIDKLVGKATDRRAAVEAIADENIKEVAKAVTDTKVIDKVMDAIDNNDQLLADLEKKLGMKKICRI
jgi:ribonucleotide reductase alpha subunit